MQNNKLETLVQTLEVLEGQKRDFIAPATKLYYLEGQLVAPAADGGIVTYKPNATFDSHVADKMGIPSAYFNKMRQSAPFLLDANVNHWLQQNKNNFLLRTFDAAEVKTARAMLSSSYCMIDNFDVLFETLEAVKKTGIHVEIDHADLTEQYMYLKVTAPEIEIKAKELLSRYARTTEVGTGIIAGFVTTNSEVGQGAYATMPRAVVLACRNGMVLTKDTFRKVHMGAKMDELFVGNEAIRKANMKLVKEQIHHAVKTFLSGEYLKKIVEHYSELGTKEITAPVDKVIEVVAKDYNFSEERKSSILHYFVKGGDTRRIGLVNAVTEQLQNEKDADIRHEGELASLDMLEKFNSIEARAAKFTNN